MLKNTPDLFPKKKSPRPVVFLKFVCHICRLMAKNQLRNWVIGSALAYGGYRLFSYYNVSQNIAYNISIWGFDKNPMNMTMILNVEVINPTLNGMTIQSVSGTITYKGTEVAQVNYLQQIPLKAKTKTDVKVPVKFKPLNILTVLLQGKPKLAVDYKLTFFTNIGSHTETGTLTV